jgi:hypothetical protein
MTIVDQTEISMNGDRPAPTLRTVEVTPLMADWLLSHNSNNRKLRPKAVDAFAALMRAGRFRGLASPPIQVSWEGVLLDGQHRLHAIVETGATQTMYLREGVDPADFDAIDNGGAGVRNANDLLGRTGIANGNALAAVANLVRLFDTRPHVTWSGSTTGRLSVQDATAEVRRQAKEYIEAQSYGSRVKEARVQGSTFAAIAFIVARQSEQMGQFDEFTKQVATGEMLASDAPAYVLRRWSLQRESGGNNTQAAFIIAAKAWNSHRNGDRVTKLVARGPNGTTKLPVPSPLSSLY